MVVIFILMAGVLDLGRLMYAYLSLYDGAQEGATYASYFPTHCAKINTRVTDSVKDLGTVIVNVYVDGAPDTDSACVDGVVNAGATKKLINACLGKEIRVTVTYTFKVAMPFMSVITGPTIVLKAQAKNMVLRPPC